MKPFHLDFETRSRLSLPEVGAWKYAADPSTQIVAMSYGTTPQDIVSIGGLSIKFNWNVAQFDIKRHDFANARITAHNAAFEYAIWNLILHRRFGWPARWNPALWDCTMARAAQVGLPMSLEALSKALELKTPKDMEGRRLILQVASPKADGTFDEDPAKHARVLIANKNDVLTEMEADALLPQLHPFERPIWEHDLIANRRGIAVDQELAEKAQGFAAKLESALNPRLLRLTGGGVTKHSQVEEIKTWIGAQGVKEYQGSKEERDGLGKVEIFKLLERPDVPEKIKEVVRIRQQLAKSSVAKYRATIDTASPIDSRVRGVLQYHAAHTGRWGGRLIQPQNYPHGFKPKEQAIAVALILAGDFDGFVARYGAGAMGALSNVLRGTIVAGEGKVLVAADLNAIEPCVLMTLAGEKEICAELRAGIKPYLPLAKRIYQDNTLTKEKNQDAYDIGKRAFLLSGYGGGWKNMQQKTYEETTKLGKPLWIPDDLAERAVTTYRETFNKVPALWNEFNTAAIAAVQNPGQNYVTAGGRVVWGMSRDRRFLVVKLPSGRFLWYWKPHIRPVKTPWGEMRDSMCYWGTNTKTKQWTWLKTYGGLLVENVTQAIARDIMALGMLAVEKVPGFHALLTVHDECVAEADDYMTGDADSNLTTEGHHAGLLKKLTAAMCNGLPPWTKDFPINADGWVGQRYHKE